MRVSRYVFGGSLALSLGCSPPLPPSSTSSGGSESGSTGGPSTETSTESDTESGSETGGPIPVCSTEWDCGLGERCLDGLCTCLGCACQSPSMAPGTIDAPDEDEDEVPVLFDIGDPPECFEDSDCAPLEFCDGGQCTQTSACVDDLDCRADWWPEFNWFCSDGLCQWRNCHAEGDAACPDGALCNNNSSCWWLEVAPSCMQAPQFEEVVAHALEAPEAASVVILDVDLDDRDDIVVLENGFVSWLTSTGVGFDPPTPWAVEPGTQIVAIAAADVHGDGVDELLVSHAAPLGVEILAAGASWPQWIGFAETMAVPEAARMLDVDFDGLPDIVTGSSVIGPMMLVEARLGDGTGTFGPLWTEEVDVFEFSQPAPFQDDEWQCTRGLGANEPEQLVARRLDHEGVQFGGALAVNRAVSGHMFFPETQVHPAGFVATAPLVDRGVLFLPGKYVELAPVPGAVALLSQLAIVDHGVEAAEFVELEGNPLAPLCRGNLEFSLDSVALGVGDFDGDGREDLLSQGTDGVLRTWLSRD